MQGFLVALGRARNTPTERAKDVSDDCEGWTTVGTIRDEQTCKLHTL